MEQQKNTSNRTSLLFLGLVALIFAILFVVNQLQQTATPTQTNPTAAPNTTTTTANTSPNKADLTAIDTTKVADTSNAQGKNQRATQLLAKGDYNKAIEVLKQLSTERSKDPAVLYNLGVAYLKKGDNEQALAQFKKALQFDANFAEAHNSMGIVYDKQHNTPQAIAAFEQYVRLNPNDSLV